jgi:hypothetical protein
MNRTSLGPRRDASVIRFELEDRLQSVDRVVDLLSSWGYQGHVRPGRDWVPLADFDLVGYQRAAIRRVERSFLRRAVWPHPPLRENGPLQVPSSPAI